MLLEVICCKPHCRTIIQQLEKLSFLRADRNHLQHIFNREMKMREENTRTSLSEGMLRFIAMLLDIVGTIAWI